MSETTDDVAYLLVERLAGELATDVCGFASHRGGNYYSWARAGSTTRSFVDAEGEIQVRGPITDAECSVGAPADEASVEPGYGVDESIVVAIAAAWCVDPTTLSSRPETDDLGRIGS